MARNAAKPKPAARKPAVAPKRGTSRRKAAKPAAQKAAAQKTAKLFMTGRSQAVRLPKEFRFEGNEVRIRRVGNGVLLEPAKSPTDWQTVFETMDRIGGDPIFPDGRQQPPMQKRKFDFE